jgi:hypothetical protein
MSSATTSNSSVASIHHIICYKGDSFARIFKFWQDDAKTQPLDITTSTFKVEVRNKVNKRTVLSFTSGAGLTIQNVNELVLSKSKTEMQIDAGVYQYDVQRTLATTEVITIIRGDFKVEDDTTK